MFFNMKAERIIYFLICFCAIKLIVLVDAKGDPCNDANRKELHGKVFSLSLPKFEPNEVRDQLKALDMKYRICQELKSDENHKNIETLLKESDEENCDFRLNDRLWDTYAAYPSLSGYLTHYRDVRYAACKNILMNKLEKELESHPAEYASYLDQLKRRSADSKSGNVLVEQEYNKINRRLFIDGILAFLDRQAGPLSVRCVNSNHGTEYFIESFEKYIKAPCTMVLVNLNSLIQELNSLRSVYAKNDHEPLGATPIKWIENFNMCKSIFGDEAKEKETIRELSYTKLLRRVSSRDKSWTDCFSCFSGSSVKD